MVDKHRLCASAADLWQHIWKQLHAIKCLLTLLRQDNGVSLCCIHWKTPQSSPFRLTLIVIHLHSCSFSTSWLQFKRKCCSWTAICYSLLTHHIYFLWFFNLERFWKWMFLTSSPAHAHGENEPYILWYNISCSHCSLQNKYINTKKPKVKHNERIFLMKEFHTHLNPSVLFWSCSGDHYFTSLPDFFLVWWKIILQGWIAH